MPHTNEKLNVEQTQANNLQFLEQENNMFKFASILA
jgi:hypothetical protein